MNIKKIFLPLLLLTSFSFVQSREKTDLNNPLLKIVDGVPGAMDAVSFKKCFDSWSVINNVQYKDLYTLLDKQITLKEAVMLEHSYKTKNVSTETAHYKALSATLVTIKKQFKDKMAPLLDQAESQSSKDTNRKLVNLWLEQQNKTTSLLSSWGATDQDAQLQKTDAKAFFVFLNDLKYFLEDLMYSCKKARKQFKEQCLKESDYATFEKFFTN